MAKSKFLSRQREANYKPANPASAEIKMNGNTGVFQIYDKLMEKGNRKSKLKQKSLTFVGLDMAKKVSFGKKAKGREPSQSTSTSFFKNYPTDTMALWVNGQLETSGKYEHIKAYMSEHNIPGKVADVYFCYCIELGRTIEFLASGTKKNILRDAFKANPDGMFTLFELKKGKEVEGDLGAYYEIAIDFLDVSKLSDEIIANVDAAGEAVVEYLDYTILQGATDAVTPDPDPETSDLQMVDDAPNPVDEGEEKDYEPGVDM